MIEHPSPPRLQVMLALMLTPDDRPQTRRAIMRAAVLFSRSNQSVLPRIVSRKLLRGMGRGQKAWTGLGIAIYQMLFFRPGVCIAFVLTIIFVAVKLALGLVDLARWVFT